MKDVDIFDCTVLYRLQEGRWDTWRPVPVCMLTHIHVYYDSERDSCLAGKTSREFFCLPILGQAG